MDINKEMKKIMGYKEQLGEFSLDLYYDDCSEATPCVAKIHGPFKFGWDFEHHERAMNFENAIQFTEDFLAEVMDKGLRLGSRQLIDAGMTHNLPRINNTTTITEI